MPRHTRLTLLGTLVATAAVLALAGTAHAGTWTVTRTDDAVDVGGCTVDDCGLREAVSAANNNVGNDTIVVPAGTYSLTGASGDNGNSSGDLDLNGTDDVTITGAGVTTTFIQAASGDRAIDHTGSGDLTLSGLTVQGGSPSNSSGGGLRTTTTLDVVISDARFTTNGISGTAGVGGGIYAAVGGTMRISNVEVDANSAATEGGGLYAVATQGLVIEGSVIHGNTAPNAFGGAGLGTTLATPTVVRNTVFHANRTNGAGSALGSTSDGPLKLRNVTLSGNVANDDAIGTDLGAIFAQDMDPDFGNVYGVDNVAKPNGGGATFPSLCYATGSATYVNSGGNVFDALGGFGCSPLATGSVIDSSLDGGTFGAFGGTGLFQVPIAGDEATFNAGLSALCTEAGTTDGRGGPRTVGASCDAGAYELGGIVDLVATLGATPTALAQGTASSTSGTLTNLGPDVAVNARLELAIPAGATAVTPTAPAGGSCSVGATKVTCTVPLLNVNDTVSASTTFTPAAGGAFTLRAAAGSAGSDTSAANDSASRSLTITALPPTDPTPADPVSPRVTFVTVASNPPARVGRTGTFVVRLSCPTGVAGGACRVSMTGRSVARYTYGTVERARTFAVTCATRSIPAGATAAVTCTVPAAVRTAVRDRVVRLRMTARSTAAAGGTAVTQAGVVRIRTRA